MNLESHPSTTISSVYISIWGETIAIPIANLVTGVSFKYMASESNQIASRDNKPYTLVITDSNGIKSTITGIFTATPNDTN